MIPPGECTYAGRKRRKPVQKRRPAMGAEKSNPSKRHRDRLNAELDHLASLLPFPPDIISKLDKLSVLRLSVSYLRVKSFFQALQETQWPAVTLSSGESPSGGRPVQEGQLMLESLHGFALVVSAEGMIFYASATIVDYLGFHQTDVMHQNIYDYIHVEDRQDFCRQLHWAMDPPQAPCAQPQCSETDNIMLEKLLRTQEGTSGLLPEYSAFLTRCFVCRVRCLLDSTSGFLTMQFQGKLKLLFGQKKKGPSGAVLPPPLSLFCTVVPVISPSAAEMKMSSTFLRARHGSDMDPRSKATTSLYELELHRKSGYFAGRSNEENSIPEFRAQMDSSCLARSLARAPCLCFRGNSDFILNPKWGAGDQEEEGQERMPSAYAKAKRQKEMHRNNCHSETSVPMRPLNWVTEPRSPEDGSKLRLEPGKKNPCPMCAAPHSSCVSYPGTQSMSSASGLATTFSDSLGSPLSAYCSQINRPLRDVHQAQVYPSTYHVPHSTLGTRLPPSGVQCFMAGGFSIEGTNLPGLPVSTGPPCSPLSLEVPIKMENDAEAQDMAGGCPPSRVCLGSRAVAKRHVVTFSAKVHLKTEPGYQPQACTQPPECSVLGAHLHKRATAGPCRELAPLYPAPCSCREQWAPHHLCTPGHRESQHNPLGCDGRAPGAGPVVKCEPLDSLSWASPGQGAVSEMFPKVPL
ncbi:aryl hydrocarbon receptor repressor [Perognathus longimembris pacificus]|uniref:aryl hydrocarbon receptor repressor n=1 Tax=Perognathus longimembris pacificus TaxID=214514 RepID=UPI002018D16E|nr:aryl hydrocarbon receptor repressor [Perognathus longimembris pacificus]